ncbi:hypothetical protein AB0O47_01985 [Streptomyces noursei]|uniref:hypothetical protein n=1 Tax=Streptomyces noursei TaxID=1971 RepID=UPI00344CA671
MHERVTAPQKYYANLPYASARGVVTSPGTSGQALFAGQKRDVLWDSQRIRLNGITTPDSTRFRVPEDGVYHVSFNATVNGSIVRSVGENLNAYLFVDGATGQGASGVMGHTTFQHQAASSYTTIQVSVTEFFTRGSSVRAQVYLDSGATGTWWISTADYDANLNIVLLTPSSNSWAEPASPPPVLRTWSDGDYIDVDTMTSQTLDVFLHLENRPRVTSRGAAFNVAAGQEKVAVSWNSMYSNDRGFALQKLTAGYADRTGIKVPYSGMYLISFVGTVQHSSGVEAASYGFQFKVHGDSDDAKILTQNSTTRMNMDCSIAVTDLIYLKSNETLNVRFYGWGPDTRWTSGTSDDRALILAATYMGG